MHYVIAKAGDHDGFGAVKMYKVLWFSEGKAWLLKGEPITGAVYIRDKHGPVPKEGLAIRRELAKEGKIREWSEPYFNVEITRFKSLSPVDVSGIDPDDLKTIDWWIAHIDEEHTAESISEESHDFAWELAKMGEQLPYYAILAQRIRPATDDEKRSALARAKKRGQV